jgi:hypothetical protein
MLEFIHIDSGRLDDIMHIIVMWYLMAVIIIVLMRRLFVTDRAPQSSVSPICPTLLLRSFLLSWFEMPRLEQNTRRKTSRFLTFKATLVMDLLSRILEF